MAPRLRVTPDLLDTSSRDVDRHTDELSGHISGRTRAIGCSDAGFPGASAAALDAVVSRFERADTAVVTAGETLATKLRDCERILGPRRKACANTTTSGKSA